MTWGKTMTAQKPKPGSPEAVERGCACPTMSNGHGKGAQPDPHNPGKMLYWVNQDCPIHGGNNE